MSELVLRIEPPRRDFGVSRRKREILKTRPEIDDPSARSAVRDWLLHCVRVYPVRLRPVARY